MKVAGLHRLKVIHRYYKLGDSPDLVAQMHASTAGSHLTRLARLLWRCERFMAYRCSQTRHASLGLGLWVLNLRLSTATFTQALLTEAITGETGISLAFASAGAAENLMMASVFAQEV